MILKFCIAAAWIALRIPVFLSNAQTPTDPQQALALHLQKAQQYLREKKPDLAIPELKAAVALDPDNPETQGNLGVLLYFKEDYAGAIEHLRAAISKQPNLAKLQGLLGIAELRTSDPADGRKDLEAAFPAIPDKKFQVQTGLELVGLYTQTTDLDDAAAILVQLRKIDPANPEILYAAYRTYSDLSSESMLSLALAAPDSGQMHQLLAHEEIKEGNTNGAIAQYRKAVAADPHLPGVHFELAELLNSASDPALKQEAIHEYQAALLANPLNEKAQCRLAEIDAQKGNAARAVDEFTQAIKLQPSDAEAKLGLAKQLTDSGQPDKALPYLEDAVQLDPTDPLAHYRLALLYRQKKQPEDFKHEMDIYQKLKDAKEKLRATYKELLIQPSEIRGNEKP